MSALRHWWRAGGRSLRWRLLLACAALAALFMLALLFALRGGFLLVMQQSVEKRLAADAAVLVSAARSEHGRLLMPAMLPDEEFSNLDSKLLGLIYDRHGQLVWQSRSLRGQPVDYQPSYDGRGHGFIQRRDRQGRAYYLYDVEIDLLRGEAAAFSVVTLMPASDYQALYERFVHQLYLWLGAAWLVLLGLLWFALTWGFASLRGLARELDELEAGQREGLGQQHPRELHRLVDSLNRLLRSEQQQRSRYRHALDDLAHSLKTPLAVLQGVAEQLQQSSQAEQGRVLQAQVERMSQQVGYQLQRASLRRSGLVRHSQPLAPLLDSLADALDKVYRDKRVQLQRDFPASLQVPMEQGALLELLGNLLENAYRLCLARVRVHASWYAGGCLLQVEDDGPGVPVEQRQRILQRGERLDSQHPGQGIGTAVVGDIVDSYEGELQVLDSSLGGACFRVRLPLG